jgi:hypothetical protein
MMTSHNSGEAEEMTDWSTDLDDRFYGFIDGLGICDIYRNGKDSRLWEGLCQLQNLWLARSNRAFEVPEATSRCAMFEQSPGSR